MDAEHTGQDGGGCLLATEQALETGSLPAAVAVSTLDISQSAMVGDNSDYHEHWILALAMEADIHRLLGIPSREPARR